MKSFAIASVIAAVSAEAGYMCKQPDPAWTDVTDTEGTLGAATDVESCGNACTALATVVEKDYCC